jgi:hypothetical protein
MQNFLNRWSNIRHATRVENSKNRGLQLNNKSGFNGVSWEKNAKLPSTHLALFLFPYHFFPFVFFGIIIL